MSPLWSQYDELPARVLEHVIEVCFFEDAFQAATQQLLDDPATASVESRNSAWRQQKVTCGRRNTIRVRGHGAVGNTRVCPSAYQIHTI